MWEQVKNHLKDNLPESTLALWVDPLEYIRFEDSTLELAAPDRIFCSWVSENLLGDIKGALGQLGIAEPRVRFTVTGQRREQALLPGDNGHQLRLPNIPHCKSFVRSLHPRYTFDEFMVGESNALAKTACESLANDRLDMGRCIYIDSGTGLGKSHLTHAVAHHIMNTSPGTRLHYLTAQQLTGEMVKSIQNSSMEQFKDKYHNNCDVLLLEDVQSLAGRAKTQEELANAIDILMDRNKRIIFTSSLTPRELPKVEAGFRSRLSLGLITSINPPDFTTRVHIIKRKAQNHDLKLSDELVVYLAEQIRGDIRQVESAIVGLKAQSSLLNKEPDFDMVHSVIDKIIDTQPDFSPAAIRDFVARQYKLSSKEIQSKSRKKTVAFPRQVGMYLSRKLTSDALADIGKAFNRDHSTVVHSVRVITETIARNGSVRGQVEHLAKQLKNKSGLR